MSQSDGDGDTVFDCVDNTTKITSEQLKNIIQSVNNKHKQDFIEKFNLFLHAKPMLHFISSPLFERNLLSHTFSFLKPIPLCCQRPDSQDPHSEQNKAPV